LCKTTKYRKCFRPLKATTDQKNTDMQIGITDNSITKPLAYNGTYMNSTMRLISRNLRSTPLPWLPVLANIEPPALRRKTATDRFVTKVLSHDHWPIHHDILNPPQQRLTSRKPLWCTMTPTNIKSHRRESWKLAPVVNDHLVDDPLSSYLVLPRQQWSLLNRFHTGHGHFAACRKTWRLTDTDLSPVVRPKRC